MMRKTVLLTIIVLFCAAVAFADGSGKIDLKVGDEVYACNCGADCPCKTMSRNPGKCACNNDMVKAKVMSVEGDSVMLKADSWASERPFKTTGKYTCACGPDCKCDTISQNPGKCTCGSEMKKVE